MMTKDIFYILLFSILFLLIFVANEFIYKKFQINSEYTRKSVHILSGLLTMFLPIVFENHFPVFILSLEFVLLLVFSIKFNFFKSINEVKRKTWGSFLFPVSVYLCFYLSIYYNDKGLFYIPMLILSLSDPIAAIFGKLFNGKSKKKTFSGSLAFLVSSFIISFVLLNMFYELTFSFLMFLSILISIFSTLIEKISYKGLDNLTIPVIILIVLHFSDDNFNRIDFCINQLFSFLY